MMSDNIPSVKCILVGDGGTGKTTFCNRAVFGNFERLYHSTIGVSIVPFVFNTNRGLIRFYVWDTAGQERSGDTQSAYFMEGQCAIIMFDVTSRITYKNVPLWHRDLWRMCSGIPIVLCGNKIDLANRKVQPWDIKYARNSGMEYFDISAKANHNIFAPFLSLARSCARDPNLYFVAMPAVMPQEIKMSQKQRNEIEQALLKAQKKDIVEDNDDL